MMNFKVLLILLVFVIPLTVMADHWGTVIGGDPIKKWEDGGNDFFVMFNSLVDDQKTLLGEDVPPINRQGDTCISESSFTNGGFYSPDDAIVVQAYLVWMAAVDPAKIAQPTDNTVHLKYVSKDATVTLEEDQTAGDTAKTLDSTASFEFEGIKKISAPVVTGCSETSKGSNSTADIGYFTYRKDITSFFTKIVEEYNKIESHAGKSAGEALYGTYTVGGLDCTNADAYKCNTTMNAEWSIVVIYKSGKISSKKIYLYTGLSYIQGEQSTSKVSGFELPSNPVVRLTSMIGEGDPNLVDTTKPPEGFLIQGPGATSKLQIINTCNPQMTSGFEVYNNISSVVSWDPKNPNLTCLEAGQLINGSTTEKMFFGIDEDTFLLDAGADENLKEHFKKGNTSLDIILSVNQDAIIPNFLIVSLDTKTPAYDIPDVEGKFNYPYNREKHYCSCRRADDNENAFCQGKPHYYLIKVQNWGTNEGTNVKVIDNLDPQLDYVPGTTEMATQIDENTGNGSDWISIPDKAGNVFPLSGDGYKVADKMEFCNQSDMTCKDTRLIRFKVNPKSDLPKHAVISNEALIIDDLGGTGYKTNKSIPLQLRVGNCQPDETCKEPKPVDCGGVPTEKRECDETKPCTTAGYTCNMATYKCEVDPKFVCQDGAEVSWTAGKNSPSNDGNKIIIPPDSSKLLIGQFTMTSNNCVPEKKFKFDAITFRVERSDLKVSLESLKLIYDKNGNGIKDSDDIEVGAAANIEGNSVKFVLSDANAFYAGKTIHYFSIFADVKYPTDTKILADTTFQFIIESKDSFALTDASGDAVKTGGKVEFAIFQLEPSEGYFIVTKGGNDPAVPTKAEMNKDIPVLQLRTKAIDAPNSISSITVNIPGSSYVPFGEKITAMSLYIDTNNDGKGETKIAEVTTFTADQTTSYTFSNLKDKLSYSKGEEKYLVINCKFNLSSTKGEDGTYVDDKAMIMINRAKVVLTDNSKTVLELPVKSKLFEYVCLEGDVACKNIVTPPPDPCGCTVIGSESNNMAVFMMLAALAMLLALRTALVRTSRK